ncbi:MarC family protein [Microbacterium luticocti]|uniref:MarC family protein n=1 Tax=Microbacterium luticocti TaxID=451764 RepID=UPI0004058682|nr:MarC family protein [Microbacterium luticocti]
MLPVFLAALAALIPITNPVAALAAFAGMTTGMPAASVHRQAWRTGIYVGGILIVFAVVGTLLLSFLGIGLPALQVAGGLVVMHSGFGMLSAKAPLSAVERHGVAARTDVSFSPMALPLIAGPGAIGVVIALSARHPALLERLGVILACVVIAVATSLVLRYGTSLVDKMGATVIGALTRVMGFLILAIGVEIGMHGLLAFLHP